MTSCCVIRSGCLIRTTYVILTLISTLVLLHHNTDLRRSVEQRELLPILFAITVLLSVIMYFTVSFMDPGFVLFSSDLQSTPVDVEELEKIPQSQSLQWKQRCGYCFLLRPMRAKHCKECKKCVRRHDHHCPWLDNCVGERNHKWFLLYLLIQLLTVSWGLHIAWSGIIFTPTLQQLLVQNGFLLGTVVVTGVFSLVILLLLCTHLYLAAINTTTWEFMSRHHITYFKTCDYEENPFDRGVICNLWDFFCVAHTVAWEKVYSRRTVGAF